MSKRWQTERDAVLASVERENEARKKRENEARKCAKMVCSLCNEKGHAVATCRKKCYHRTCSTTPVHLADKCPNDVDCTVCGVYGHAAILCRKVCRRIGCVGTAIHDYRTCVNTPEYRAPPPPQTPSALYFDPYMKQV